MFKRAKSVILKSGSIRIEVLFLIGLAILLLNMIRLYLTIPYNSDDVSQQALLQQWLNYGFATTWFPVDTFILKFPIHFLIDVIGLSPRHTAFVSMVFMNVVAYLITFISFRSLSRSIFKINNDVYWVLPLLFVYSINSLQFSYSIKNSNLRIIESAIMFGILALVARWVTAKRSSRQSHQIRAWLGISLSAIGLGLFYYNDPAFVVFLGTALATLLLILGINFTRNKYIFYKLTYFIVVSLLAFKIFEKLFSALGFKSYETYANFVDYDKFWASLSNALHGLLTIFGADFFGKLASSFVSIRAIGAFAILNLFVYFLYKYFRSIKISDINPWEFLIASQPVLIFVGYFISENSTDLFTARYLYLLPFYMVLIVALSLTKLIRPRFRVYILTFILLITSLNVLSSIANIYHARNNYNPADNHRNELQLKIVDAVTAEGLTKGYAGFWSTNINNYFSDGKLAITPISCNEPQTRIFNWLYTEKLSKIHADKTFLIVSKGNEAAPPDYGKLVARQYECNVDKLNVEFGVPSKILQLTPNTEIFVYDYDIGTRFGQRINERTP